MLKHAIGMFFNDKTPQGDFLRFALVAILGLPRKIGNANIKPQPQGWGFFLPKSVHRTLLTARSHKGTSSALLRSQYLADLGRKVT